MGGGLEVSRRSVSNLYLVAANMLREFVGVMQREGRGMQSVCPPVRGLESK